MERVEPTETVEVVEFTDPWCSWAWGTEPKLRRLRWRYGDRLRWRTVVGDLVPDRASADPSFDAAAAGPRLAEYWRGTHQHTGQPWPAQLRWAPTLSAHACRAVKAAALQGDAVGAGLLRALRESCFVFGAPADREDRILEVAAGVAGLSVSELSAALSSARVEEAFQSDRAETRRPNHYVRTLQETHAGAGNAKPDGDGWRYVFPTLLFRGPGGEHTVPGWQPVSSYEEAMEAAVPGSTGGGRADPTPEEAFATWPLLTACELEFLCGPDAKPVPGAIEHDFGGGRAWSTPAV